MPNLYALLVGIDAYPIPGHQLQGCVNDATAFRSLLQSRYSVPPERILTLLNEQATRQNVISCFRQHLGQAQSGDIAVFFYAGHGSQVPTGGLFKEIEPDGLNESLVCYDSRMPGQHDLVDKDVATLISEVTARGAHVTAVLDSCHSGSATRDLTETVVRRVPARADAQPASVYLRAPEESVASRLIRDSAAASSSLSVTSVSSFSPDLSGRHILMSACQDFQSANEYKAGNVHHGAFTYCLLEVLNSTPERLGYEELCHRTRLLVESRVPQQTPQLEALGGDDSLRNLFLGLIPGPVPDFYIASYSVAGHWTIDAGLLHGLRAGDSVRLYRAEATGAELQNAARAIATATLAMPNPSESILDIGGAALDTSRQYKAVPASRALRINVLLQGEAAGLALLRPAIASSPWLQEGPDAKLVVNAGEGQFRIDPVGTNSPVGPFPQTPDGAGQMVVALEHMSKWVTRFALGNPSSAIPVSSAQFTVIRSDNSKLECPPLTDLRLAYASDSSGRLEQPSFRLRITNASNQVLYFALLVFSESWSIVTGLIAGGTQRLAPGEQLYPYSGKPIHTSISSSTATESNDYLLLIISTDLFDATAFALPSMAQAVMATRDLEIEPEAPLPTIPAHDFCTRRVHVQTVRSVN